VISPRPELRGALTELVPLLRRAVDLDPVCLARLCHGGEIIVLFVRLPFGVLVSRALRTAPAASLDVTVRAVELLQWAEQESTPPEPRDADWRAALPPRTGWRRIDSVPDHVVRDLVRSGALALQEAAGREGVPGAQPRGDVAGVAGVADALLDAVVLTATANGAPDRAAITLRTVSALTRMGFLARGSHANVDRAGRWTRVSGRYGSVYAEEPGGLNVLR
jgi:hypothetical protein